MCSTTLLTSCLFSDASPCAIGNWKNSHSESSKHACVALRPGTFQNDTKTPEPSLTAGGYSYATVSPFCLKSTSPICHSDARSVLTGATPKNMIAREGPTTEYDMSFGFISNSKL
eukprot:CAMPEP_0197693454 /NCGR_PEP_ID=MMETSP1338-20131121/112518_1 /TAXON_ID=43686 ORGANISM="Pelagodinium beii, Strain RCC1491" /NCGR_SAMPLE_ID=MMETSP1338 /ASSEMBLY_ACC=CAM_ASM_000754 /LENGTH=114 /DNA_ID=CAMNT_0043276203 /DNA_START=153 /DNA_END=497 /DNA_ORIENTATION=-